MVQQGCSTFHGQEEERMAGELGDSSRQVSSDLFGSSRPHFKMDHQQKFISGLTHS